jgi:hypothetical protein
MKTKFFMAALAATMIFSSCNNEEIIDNGGTTTTNKSATLKVSIASIAPRATETNTGNDDMLPVKEATVIVFNAAGEIKQSVVLATADPVKEIAPITTSTDDARRVLVVTNLNDVLAPGGSFNTSITNVQQLHSVVETEVTLRGGAGPKGASDADLVILAGDVNIDWGTPDVTLSPEGIAMKTVNLDIRPVSSKLNITVVLQSEFKSATDIETGNSPGLLRFKDSDGLRILNANSQTRIMGASPFVNYNPTTFPWLVPGGTDMPFSERRLFSGMKTDDFTYGGGTKEVHDDFLADDMTNAAAGTHPFHYYLFENNANVAAAFPSIVVIQATWGWTLNVGHDGQTPDSDGLIGDFDTTNWEEAKEYEYRKMVAGKLKERSVYFSLHMTTAGAGKNVSNYGAGVQRGKAYDMRLTLRNSLIDKDGEYWFPELPLTEEPGEGPDPKDPTEEDSDASLTVEVTVVEWVDVDIDHQW